MISHSMSASNHRHCVCQVSQKVAAFASADGQAALRPSLVQLWSSTPFSSEPARSVFPVLEEHFSEAFGRWNENHRDTRKQWYAKWHVTANRQCATRSPKAPSVTRTTHSAQARGQQVQVPRTIYTLNFHNGVSETSFANVG